MRKPFALLAACLMLAGMVAPASVVAGEADPDQPSSAWSFDAPALRERFRIAGFGTLAATTTSLEDADYRTRIEQREGVGRTESTSLGMDSVLAAQLDARITAEVTATVQLVSRRVEFDDYSPGTEWAYLKYWSDENWYLRAGRLVAPAFYNSNVRSIGYAQTWLRPPVDVYLLNPLTWMEGGDIGSVFRAGDATIRAALAYGTADTRIYVTETSVSELVYRNWIAHASLETGPHRVRAMVWDIRGRIGNVPDNQILSLFETSIDALVAAGLPGASTLRGEIAYTEPIQAWFHNVGYGFMHPVWVVEAELVQRWVSGTAIQDAIGGYVLAGRRIAHVTPYLMYSEVRSGEDKTLPRIDASGQAMPLPFHAAVVNTIADVMTTNRSSHTIAMGARIDPMENLAVKAQWDHVRKPMGSPGDMFVNADPVWGATRQSVNVLTVAVDFVF